MEMSNRGFMHGNDIPDTYGGYVRVYESSSAEGPHIWVKVMESGEAARAHLTLDSAIQLRDELTLLIENHYQVKPWDGHDPS